MYQKHICHFLDYVYSYFKFCQEDFYVEHYTAQKETWTQSKCKWRPLLESIVFERYKNNLMYRRQTRGRRKNPYVIVTQLSHCAWNCTVALFMS